MARRNGYMWWIDRWRKSTAYTDMTLEEQGAYRNLLDEATLRGGALPNHEHVLTKACGDPRRWAKVRTAVLAHFALGPDGCWHNETLDLINAKSAAISADRSVAGASGNGRKWGPAGIANASQTGRKPVAKGIANLSPPDPDQDQVQKDPPSESLSAPSPPTNRGSQHGRIFVHPWQLHALIDTLGPHAPAFGLDEWVFSLSELADVNGLVLDKRDVWGWVQQQLSEEIQRRGLPVAGAVPSEASILARAREEIDRQNAAVRRG